MKRIRWLSLLLGLFGWTALTDEMLWSQQRPPRPGGRIPPIISGEPSPPTPPTVSRRMLRASFEQLQKDVVELAELAETLKEEINKANEDVLPLSELKKAEEIEKLAKRIQGRIKNL